MREAVDLNSLHRVSLETPKIAKLWTPLDTNPPKVRVVAVEELVVG